MILHGNFEFRGVEKRNKKDGGCYVLAHFETLPFDGYLHNFLLTDNALSVLDGLSKGDICDVTLEYNELYKSFKASDIERIDDYKL